MLSKLLTDSISREFSFLIGNDLTPWLNTVHQGDCARVMRRIPAGSVDLVFTSPPYNLRTSSGNGRLQDHSEILAGFIRWRKQTRIAARDCVRWRDDSVCRLF